MTTNSVVNAIVAGALMICAAALTISQPPQPE
jgi:hypothetical protein